MQDEQNEGRKSRERAIKADDAFCARMLRAIALGKEHPEVGVKVDTTAGSTRRFYPNPAFSSCGSPASECADLGAGERSEFNYA